MPQPSLGLSGADTTHLWDKNNQLPYIRAFYIIFQKLLLCQVYNQVNTVDGYNFCIQLTKKPLQLYIQVYLISYKVQQSPVCIQFRKYKVKVTIMQVNNVTIMQGSNVTIMQANNVTDL